MASVGVLQIANYVVPLLVIPFVTRALGKEAFGAVSYAQNIVVYLTVLVTFGYEYSATQDIVLNRTSPDRMRIIFWTVVRSRLKLFAVSLLLLVCISFFVDRIQESPLLYMAAALINLGVAVYPTWFFQGIEEMGKMAVAGFFIKAVGGVLIILLVTTPADGLLYLLLLSLSYVVVGVGTLWYVVKHYDMTFPEHSDRVLSRNVVRRGWPIFLNTFFNALYTSVGITILGWFVDDAGLGIYTGAFRIIMAIMVVANTPINLGVFPVISRKWDSSYAEGWLFFRKALLLAAAGGILLTIFTYLFAPLLVKILLGGDFTESVSVLKRMALLPPLVITTSLLTVQGLYGLRKQNYAPYISASVAVIGLPVTIWFITLWGIMGAVYAWIISLVCEMIISSTILLTLHRRSLTANINQ